MANEQIFHVGVKALMSDEKGRILLLKADVSDHKTKGVQPYWDIPGGRVQAGQTVLDTLAREVLEETGVSVYTQPPHLQTTVISRHTIPLDDSLTVGLLLVVYKVSIDPSEKIVLSPEHSEYEWVTPAEAAARLSEKYPAEFTDNLQ